jgi:hypothetical protein
MGICDDFEAICRKAGDFVLFVNEINVYFLVQRMGRNKNKKPRVGNGASVLKTTTKQITDPGRFLAVHWLHGNLGH